MWKEILFFWIDVHLLDTHYTNYIGINSTMMIESKLLEYIHANKLAYMMPPDNKRFNAGGCIGPFVITTPGGRLNKKDGLTRYGDSHVKDKTS